MNRSSHPATRLFISYAVSLNLSRIEFCIRFLNSTLKQLGRTLMAPKNRPHSELVSDFRLRSGQWTFDLPGSLIYAIRGLK